MNAWHDWLILAEGAIAVLVALGLVAFSRRTPPTLLLAAYVGLWGVVGLVVPFQARATGIQDHVIAAMIAIHFPMNAALVGFALSYPNITLTRTRRWVIAGLFGAAFVIAGLILADPSPLVRDGELQPLAWATMGILIGFSFFTAFVLLARRWLASPPGDYRTQILWGLIPVTFWVLHDGLGWGLFPVFLGPRFGLEWLVSSPTRTVGSVLTLLSVAGALAVWGVAVTRTLRRRAARDDRALALVVLYLLPVVLLQIFDPGFTQQGFVENTLWVHVALDYVVVGLIVYGVLRFNVVDLDLRVKWGVRHGTVAAAFVAVFFIGTELAAMLFEDVVGSAAVGIALAGLLLFAIHPLHRLATRVADRAMPRVEDTESYLNYRRFQIYRVALEGTLRDGVLAPAETNALRSLRTELGLSETDHAMLEDEVRRRLRAGPA